MKMEGRKDQRTDAVWVEVEGQADVLKREQPSAVVVENPTAGRMECWPTACPSPWGVSFDTSDRVHQDGQHEAFFSLLIVQLGQERAHER